MSSGRRSTPSTRTARSQLRWLSPTCSSSTRSGETPNRSAMPRWRLIATLHSPIARWPASSSAWLTIPTGLVKSTIHAPGRAALRGQLGELEDHGHGPQRLREAAGAGRLLADDAERRRQRLVDEAGRLPADAQLDEHEVGAVDGGVAVAGAASAGRSSRAGRASAGPARRRSRGARGSMSSRTSSSIGMRSRRASKPSTSSGV